MRIYWVAIAEPGQKLVLSHLKKGEILVQSYVIEHPNETYVK